MLLTEKIWNPTNDLILETAGSFSNLFPPPPPKKKRCKLKAVKFSPPNQQLLRNQKENPIEKF